MEDNFSMDRGAVGGWRMVQQVMKALGSHWKVAEKALLTGLSPPAVHPGS